MVIYVCGDEYFFRYTLIHSYTHKHIHQTHGITAYFMKPR